MGTTTIDPASAKVSDVSDDLAQVVVSSVDDFFSTFGQSDSLSDRLLTRTSRALSRRLKGARQGVCSGGLSKADAASVREDLQNEFDVNIWTALWNLELRIRNFSTIPLPPLGCDTIFVSDEISQITQAIEKIAQTGIDALSSCTRFRRIRTRINRLRDRVLEEVAEYPVEYSRCGNYPIS